MNKNILKFGHSPRTRGKANIKLLIVFVFLFSFLFLPSFARAECLAMDANGNCTQTGGFLDSPRLTAACMANGNCSLDDIAQGFIALTEFLIGAIGALALLYFIWGGIKWLTSYGNQQKIQQGREIMLQTVIALVVAFMSYILVEFFVNDLLQVKPEVQVNTNTTYSAEPGQNNTDNNQPSVHCCVDESGPRPNCQLASNGICPSGLRDLGTGACPSYDICFVGVVLRFGCCIDGNICEPVIPGGTCFGDFQETNCQDVLECSQ